MARVSASPQTHGNKEYTASWITMIDGHCLFVPRYYSVLITVIHLALTVCQNLATTDLDQDCASSFDRMETRLH